VVQGVLQGYCNIDLVFLSRADLLDVNPYHYYRRTVVHPEQKLAMMSVFSKMQSLLVDKLAVLQWEKENIKLHPNSLAAVSEHGKQLAQCLENIRANPQNLRGVWCIIAGNYGLKQERSIDIIDHMLFFVTNVRKTDKNMVNGYSQGKGWLLGCILMDGSILEDPTQISLAEFLAQPIIGIPVQGMQRTEKGRYWRTGIFVGTMFHNQCCNIPSCRAEACMNYQTKLNAMSENDRKAEDKLNEPRAAPAVSYVPPTVLPSKANPARKKTGPKDPSESESSDAGMGVLVSSDESVGEVISTDDDELSDLGEHDMPSLKPGELPSSACLHKMWLEEKKEVCRGISKTNNVKENYRKLFREMKVLKTELKRNEKKFASLRKLHSSLTSFKNQFSAVLGPHGRGKVVEARPSGGAKGKDRKQDSDSEEE
jgi:hypothetical protein